MTEVDELLARLKVEATECDNWDQPDRAYLHRDSIAMIRRLFKEIKGIKS